MYTCISMAHFFIRSVVGRVSLVALGAFAKRDSLSPILFVIVMEAFSRMLSRALASNYLSKFRVDIQNVAPLEISHPFANDTFYYVMQIEIKSIIWVTFSCF
jgi:hypothetical protein